MKIHPVGAQLFHVDGQTDMMKLTVTSCNFANMLKNKSSINILLGLNCPFKPVTGTLQNKTSYNQSVTAICVETSGNKLVYLQPECTHGT